MQGIQRYAVILDEISAGPDSGLSITELCQSTGLPKGTVHRMLEAMGELGLVVREESKKWRLGPRVAFWAGKYLEGPASLAPLRRFVGRLSSETRFFSYLAVLDREEIVCVAVERPEGKAHFFVQLGSRVPVLSTAAAKALLSYQPAPLVRSVVARAMERESSELVEHSTVDSYLEELSEVRSSGYAKCMEELEPGVSAIGAPIVGIRGHSVASLSVVAPTAALVADWDANVERLLCMAGEASSMLGRRVEIAKRL